MEEDRLVGGYGRVDWAFAWRGRPGVVGGRGQPIGRRCQIFLHRVTRVQKSEMGVSNETDWTDLFLFFNFFYSIWQGLAWNRRGWMTKKLLPTFGCVTRRGNPGISFCFLVPFFV